MTDTPCPTGWPTEPTSEQRLLVVVFGGLEQDQEVEQCLQWLGPHRYLGGLTWLVATGLSNKDVTRIIGQSVSPPRDVFAANVQTICHRLQNIEIPNINQ